MTDSHSHTGAVAALSRFEREQVERYRRKSEPVAPEPRRPADVSVPLMDVAPPSPLAQADAKAAHQMVAKINQLQAEGSISTPMFGGDR